MNRLRVRRWVGALITVALAGGAVPSNVTAAPVIPHEARWQRALAARAGDGGNATIFALLGDGNVLVRSGTAVTAVDARSGATRWSLPNVTGATVGATSVILRRPDLVFAVRTADAAVLWKHACGEPPFAVVVGERVLTACGGVSTVLNGRDGGTIAKHAIALPTGQPHFIGARALNERYALVENSFEGAWIGVSSFIVDTATAAFLRSDTSMHVLDVSEATITVTPYPSGPGIDPGSVAVRRISDGAVVAQYAYQIPPGSNTEGRGDMIASRAATYVRVSPGPLFRFRQPDRKAPALLFPIGADVEEVIGSAAFIKFGTTLGHDTLLLDRPGRGGFVTSSLGPVEAPVVAGGDSVAFHAAARTGDRVAVARFRSVTLYDEHGTAELVAQNACLGVRRVVVSRATLFVLCDRQGAATPPVLTAYAR